MTERPESDPQHSRRKAAEEQSARSFDAGFAGDLDKDFDKDFEADFGEELERGLGEDLERDFCEEWERGFGKGLEADAAEGLEAGLTEGFEGDSPGRSEEADAERSGTEEDVRELLERLNWHAEHVAMAAAARNRLMTEARYRGAGYEEVEDAAGLSRERARALARQALVPARLRPGCHLRVSPSLLADDEALAAALTGLYARLVGVVPPENWSRERLEKELPVALAPRMPLGHTWRLTLDEATGGFAYGVWPDTYPAPWQVP